MSNITPLPRFDINNVSQSLRQLANRIDGGEYGNVVRAVVILEVPDRGEDVINVANICLGEEPFDVIRAVGLCQTVIHDMLER